MGLVGLTSTLYFFTISLAFERGRVMRLQEKRVRLRKASKLHFSED